MLTIIDFWLLGRLEKFANWWQKLTGKNCFWLAKMSTIFYGFSGVALEIRIILRSKEITFTVIRGLMMFGFFALAIWFFRQVKFREKIVYKSHDLNLSNPFKIIDHLLRKILLLGTLTFGIASLLAGEFSVIGILISVLLNIILWQALLNYFSACDSLPPANKSKIKEWKEKLVNAIKGVFAPDPQPSPVPCE